MNENEQSVSVEVHILNFQRDIYQELIKIEFVEYLRPEVKFESVEKLTWQLRQD